MLALFPCDVNVCAWRLDFGRRDTWGPEKTLHAVTILDVNTKVSNSLHVTCNVTKPLGSPLANVTAHFWRHDNATLRQRHSVNNTANWAFCRGCGHLKTHTKLVPSFYLRVIVPRFTGIGQYVQLLRVKRLLNCLPFTLGANGVAWPRVRTPRTPAQPTATAQRHRAGQLQRAQLTFSGGVPSL